MFPQPLGVPLLRAGAANVGPGSSGMVTETRGRAWSQTPCGARDTVTWGEPGFSVPHPSNTSLGRERGWWVPWAAPGTDRDPSQQKGTLMIFSINLFAANAS